MKKLMTVLGLVTISCSAFAANREADFDTLMMVNSAKQSCPQQFAEATTDRSIFSIVQTDAVMKIETGIPAATLNSSKQTTHLLTITSKRSTAPSPSGMVRFEFECKLEAAN